ncbi:MAG: O-antigen ligase family protein [Mangrovibacterium sp.]
MTISNNISKSIGSFIISLIPLLSLWGISSVFLLLVAVLIPFVSKNYDASLKLTKVDWSFVVVFAFPLLAVIFTMLATNTWQWACVDKYLRYPLGGLAFFFMLKSKKNVVDLAWLRFGFYAAALVGFVYAYYQKEVLGMALATGGIFPISFGEVMAFIAVISLLKFDDSKSNAFVWRLLFFALALLASIMAGTKGAWVAYPILLWFIFDFHYEKHLGKQIGIFLVSLSLVSIILWSIPFSQNRIKLAVSDVTGYFSQEEFHPTSQGLRFMMWHTALEMYKDHPWFGVGAPQVRTELAEYCKTSPNASVRKTFPSYQHCLTHVHNDWLEALAGQGLLGFFSFVFFAFYSMVVCLVNRKKYTGEARMWIYFNILTNVAFAIFCCTQALHTAPRDLWIAFSAISFAQFRIMQRETMTKI